EADDAVENPRTNILAPVLFSDPHAPDLERGRMRVLWGQPFVLAQPNRVAHHGHVTDELCALHDEVGASEALRLIFARAAVADIVVDIRFPAIKNPGFVAPGYG